jgi:L-asparagine transporter-like permease
MLVNIAYFAAATKAEIENSEATAASVFFKNVFGGSGAAKALNFLVCVSAFGNLIAGLIGTSRMIRECGR